MENTKSYTGGYIKEINVEERTITAWASKATLDRDTEIIRGKAWDTEDFQKHPIILINHKRNDLWVAKALWTKKSKEGLLFKAQFATTEAAQEAFQLIKDTDMAAFSVGFEVKEFKDMTVSELEDFEKESLPRGIKSTERVRVFTKVKLFEISLVSLPAHPTALLLAAQEDRIKTKSLIDDIGIEMVGVEMEEKNLPDRYTTLSSNNILLSDMKTQLEKVGGMTEKVFREYVDELITLKESVEKELADAEPAEVMVSVKMKDNDDDTILVNKDMIAQAVKEKLSGITTMIKETTEREIKRAFGRVI